MNEIVIAPSILSLDYSNVSAQLDPRRNGYTLM